MKKFLANVNTILKVTWCTAFFALIAAPTLYLFGLPGSKVASAVAMLADFKSKWTTIQGYESDARLPGFTFSGFGDRTYQNKFTEAYSKKFFPRAAFLRTAYQLREYMNFGLFHYGYANSVLEGRDGILFERPYAEFHLTCPRPGGKEKYAEVMKVVCDMNEFCKTNGILFAFLTMPDKAQAYPEYLPRWLDWLFGYANYDTQGELARIFGEAGVAVFDANRYLLDRKGDWETWIYPPGGTHFSAYGIGLVYRGFFETFVDTGRIDLRMNRFVGVRKIDCAWHDEDDIANLMNLWWNPHLASNVHAEPVFEQTNVVLNAGSLITVGDCYRSTVSCVFRDAGVFDAKKILTAPRGAVQDPKAYRDFAGDLRLVLLCFQSFNTGRLDARRDELKAIFTALKEAVREAKSKDKEKKS